MVLILASQSAIRAKMLTDAGVAFEVCGAPIDEAALKADGADAATLAVAKALAVSAARPGEWVIGGDSVVRVDDVSFDKPRDRDEAASHLRCFSGRTMRLTSAVALARDGRIDWSHCETAMLEVRVLGEAFIAAYLDAEWPAVSHCVGVFRMEGRGVQLFTSVAGDHFTILGMPLVPLLGALRDRGLVAS